MDDTTIYKMITAKQKEARAIKSEDVTSTDQNARTLRKIRCNDSTLEQMIIAAQSGEADGDEIFRADEGDDLGWLGYFIGHNEKLKRLGVLSLPTNSSRDALLKGINCNRSIEEFLMSSEDNVFNVNLLTSFFSNNHKLKSVNLDDNNLGNDGVAVLAKALINQPQLQHLSLANNNIGRSGCLSLCSKLSSVSGWAALDLRNLNLGSNAIDDVGLKAIVDYLSRSTSIEKLTLSGNSSITVDGLRSLSTLFQSDNCCLAELWLMSMKIGDEEAEALAEALVGNKTLTHLIFVPDDKDFTEAGWDEFSWLLCDSSSVNDIYFSHHSLHNLGQDFLFLTISEDGQPNFRAGREFMPHELLSMLELNESILEVREAVKHSIDENLCAMLKVFLEDDDLDIQPLFSYELKLLPLVAEWFRRAKCCREFLEETTESFQSRELTTMYKFVHSMPLLVVNAYMPRDQKRKRLLGDTSPSCVVESKPCLGKKGKLSGW